jgi:hypothetical protein
MRDLKRLSQMWKNEKERKYDRKEVIRAESK